MSRLLKISIFLVAILIPAFIVGCSSQFRAVGEDSASTREYTSQPAVGNKRTSVQGGVTIEVEWVRSQDAAENNNAVFQVAMDTHSINLDGYDLKELAVLRDDKGNEYTPASWESGPGGHHREGILTFSLAYSPERSGQKSIEMVIRDVAGVSERVLRWQL
ncbi:MAG: hypothetical protein A2Z29_03715 [Chloroflexi bacterium RBG_16_56_11]|nr:MAG: hypothetical protein A2Z29_03715 [Chloroflexi bacterium RBG_16_56_11]